MTETLREAVARAMAEAFHERFGGELTEENTAIMVFYGSWITFNFNGPIADAAIRTVLERLREHQTPVRMSSTGPDGVPSYPTEHQMQYIWQAMLDAAAREVIRDPAPSGPST